MMLSVRSALVLFAFLFSCTFIVTNGLMMTTDSNHSLEEHIHPREEVMNINDSFNEDDKTNSVNKQVPTQLKKGTIPAISTGNPPQIIIYHSHNRESWIPELENIKDPDRAFDSKINVTLLGRYLQNKLKLSSSKIPVLHSKIDYPSRITNFNYAKSYSYSKTTINQELKMHQNVKYLLDLHRDSQGREKTTITHKNKNFAQVYFVVGINHPNWKENMEFANRIQEGLNKIVPNLSKGIYQKDKNSGNGEYNQSLSSNSALIEIGGVENSLDESYHTIEVLAKVIQDIWLEDNSGVVKSSSPSI
ncbi:stage II sporulation protein P [Paenibacillus sp. LHD-38]|uniref:stage II sporulation protein P n=1 Tax=Paenibacillus sp. LHD-38 TaxID=3072143 RepID=UPI00280E662E|nr:stage II sporulation protein P [Paenibacillus sp. LHD-38]MDQ8734871.1 stage II sporulation protein P [Paenibacillus sp. LHD-38]